jgi:hypothetical protein
MPDEQGKGNRDTLAARVVFSSCLGIVPTSTVVRATALGYRLDYELRIASSSTA